MLKRIKYFFQNFIGSRTILLYVLFGVLAFVLLNRIFQLQIIEGADKQTELELKIKKERSISSTRGNIYDCNGKVLAYNELSHSVTIEDVYESGSQKNTQLNATLKEVLNILWENGDDVSYDFHIYIDENGDFAFDVSGTRLLRFLADVYGYATIDKLSEREKNATADQVIYDLAASDSFGIGSRTDPEDSKSFQVGLGYTKQELLDLTAIRYTMRTTSYQKYIPVTIATDVSEESVAKIQENLEDLDGIEIAEDTIRKYPDGPYYSHIIGYTGKISTEELEALNSPEGLDGVQQAPDAKEYELNDIVGKSGIEKVMEEYLQGTKGYETVMVDRMGREIEVIAHVDPSAGNDVYLTIDADLQAAVYNILEKFVAGILVDKIINVKNYDSENVSSANLKIPIDDVYSALFENNVIDISALSQARENEVQYEVYQAFLSKQEEVFARIRQELESGTTPYNQLPEEYQVYESYMINTLLSGDGVLTGVDTKDETYLSWTRDEVISIREYLQYAISQNWIDVTKLVVEGKYSDSEEVYRQVVNYIMDELDCVAFDKLIYRYMIEQGRISGQQVCMLLIEQDVINPSEDRILALKSGEVSAFSFMVDLIRNLEITPAQLALDPYSASCVITDVNTGDVKALVSYPSYDNNRLANGIDSEYYARVSSGEDLSKPMWNYATQMKTAPGSTFKMVSATAALMENVATLSTEVNCTGIFTRFADYQPRCWRTSGHGNLNITEAITNSCNLFFYEMGYQMAMDGDTFSTEKGNEILIKYADMFGLTEKSGVEIEESEPQLSDMNPIVSAIGQGNHNFTTVGLARYVTAVANSGTCYNLTLLDRVTDRSGNLLKDYEATVRNTIELPEAYWNALHEGMRGVVEAKAYYRDFPVEAAGKTGTAEEDKSRPNHGLFVGYAPYDTPEIALAIRIGNGYSSDYASQISKQVLTWYYDLDEEGKLTDSGTALTPDAISGGGD